MISGRFMASKISGATTDTTASKLSSFFQSNVSALPSLGQSGRTFTVQKGAPTPKPQASNEPNVSSEKTDPSDEQDNEVVEPKGPEPEPPQEDDEVHS